MPDEQLVVCKPISIGGMVIKDISYDASGRVVSILESEQGSDRYLFSYSNDTVFININDEDTVTVILNSAGDPVRAINSSVVCDVGYYTDGRVQSIEIYQVSSGGGRYSWKMNEVVYENGDLVAYDLEQMNPGGTWTERVYANYDTTKNYVTYDPTGKYHACFLLGKKSSLGLFDPQLFSKHLINAWDRRELGWHKLTYDHVLDDNGYVTAITVNETLDNSFSEESRVLGVVDVTYECAN